MEKGMQHIDFVNVDSMVQVHDYLGVSLFGSRTAKSKQATKEVIKVMQDNYPEVLVRTFHHKFWLDNLVSLTSNVMLGQEILYQCAFLGKYDLQACSTSVV